MLSVIIPTRNRADLLKLALLSLQSQTLSVDSFEVLVIDNGSTDNTKQVVASFQQQFGNIRYFFDPTPGLHVGRHLGMKMAKTDILVYADDDIEAFPTWLEAIAETFQDPDVVLVGGKNLPKFESEPLEWILKMWEADKHGNRILGYLSILDLGDEKKEINPYHVFGCNFSIRKAILQEAGGFHPDAMPQELIKYRGDGESHVSKFVLERGLRCIFDNRASVYHAVTPDRMTIEYFRKRAYNQGVSDSYTQLRNAQAGGVKSNQTENPVALTKRLLRAICNRLLMFISDSGEFRELCHVIREGHDAGFAYHQMVYRDDPQVRSWVHKRDYM
jgi:glycosyltransferase involved in cell wall biosynthesis